ncbi:hypothetical protein CRYUN_Cryun27aG0092300 [Craigia yunnanensis]
MVDELKPSDELSRFLDSGIYRFPNLHGVFIDPVRVLNRSYTRFRVSPSAYYSRFFESKHSGKNPSSPPIQRNENQNRRNNLIASMTKNKPPINAIKTADFPVIMSKLGSDFCYSTELSDGEEHSFIELGRVWQAPLYDITLNFKFSRLKNESDNGENRNGEQRVLPVFNSLADTRDEVEAEFLNRHYILPRQSCFYMSDLRQIHVLIPAESDSRFNLIVIDPPRENGSAHQKSGAKGDDSLISDLDLFLHRPYECLLLGYCHGKCLNFHSCVTLFFFPFMFVELLLERVPGVKPARCIELFDREMVAGWVSWGNEPLHFQDSRYFQEE